MTAIDKALYTAKTHTTGGRDGASRTPDGRLDVRLSSPGTSGGGTNPEQLFAAGWSACFLSALGLAAAQRKAALPADRAIDAELAPRVAASVHLRRTGGAGAGYGGDRGGRPAVRVLLRAGHLVRPGRCGRRPGTEAGTGGHRRG